MQYQLKTRQICFFLIAFMSLSKIFVLPSLLSDTAGEDLWISALFNIAIDLLTLIAIIYACKKTKCDFFTLLESNIGKVGAKIVLALYFVYFLFKSILPIFEQKEYVELTLYTLKPNVLYFLPFFILAFYICTKKIRVLGRISDVLWLITINGIVTLFALSLNNADFSAILPIGAQGFSNIASGTYSALNKFGDCVYVMFLIGQFEYKNKDGLKIVLSFLVSAFIILAFMIIFYSVFTSIAFRQRFAFTEISKYSTVINNLGRFDYIGIILILFSNVFALTLPIYFCTRTLNRLFAIKNAFISPAIIIGLLLVLVVFFGQFIVSIENFIVVIAGPFFFIMSNVFPILICIFSKKGVKNSYEKG